MSTAAPVLEAQATPRRRNPWGIALAVAFLGATLALLHVDGVGFGTLARYGAYLVWGLLIPGFVGRRLLWAPARTWFGEVVWAATVGLALELVAWLVCVGVGAPWLLRFWPVVMLALVLVPGVRTRLRRRPRSGMSTTDAIVAFVSGVSLLWMMHRSTSEQLLPGRGQATYPDLLWHMGLVHEARRSFPLGTPQAVDAGTLHYHWFSDAHMAAATLMSGVGVPVEVLRLFPALFFLLVFGASVAAVQEVTASRWAVLLGAPLAAATTTFAPFPWLYSSFTSYASLSPSQLYAGPFTVMAVLAIARLVDVSRRSVVGRSEYVRAWGAVVLSGLALSGAKASAPASLLGGVGLVWMWSLATKQARRTTTVLLGGWVVLAVGALALVAGGDSGTQKQLFAVFGASPAYKRLVTPHPGTGMILPHLLDHPWLFAGLLTGLATTLCLLVGTAVAAFGRHGRRSPLLWVLLGTITAATLVFLVMRHLGLSEFYFVMGVLQLGVIGSAVALADGLDAAVGRQRRVIGGVLGVSLLAALAWLGIGHVVKVSRSDLNGLVQVSVVAFVVVVILLVVAARLTRASLTMVLLACATGVSMAATVYTPIVTKPHRIVHSNFVRHEQAAGAWIEHHVPEQALLATNKHCSGREATVCKSNQWWVSGLGGRRTLVDGWSYVPSSANDEPFFDTRLLSENQRAFTVGDEASVDALKRRGVQYLVAVRGATPIAAELARMTVKVYGNPDVNIYRVR